jgi:hypothetical protein
LRNSAENAEGAARSFFSTFGLRRRSGTDIPEQPLTLLPRTSWNTIIRWDSPLFSGRQKESWCSVRARIARRVTAWRDSSEPWDIKRFGFSKEDGNPTGSPGLR